MTALSPDEQLRLAAVDPGLPARVARLRDGSARVAVLLGGMSTERAISLKSGHAVAGALRARGWDVAEIDVGPDLPARLVASGADAAWLALHGAFGEDGAVQGLLEVMRLPYTGSGVLPSAVAMDKVTTKRLLAREGVRLPDDRVWRRGEPLPDDLAFPLMAKTPRGGSTLGVLPVDGPAALEGALVELLKFDEVVLLEQRITGDEITVAVYEGRALPVVAIRPHEGFFDFEAKYTKGRTDYIVPAPIAPAAAADATRQALAAWAALGLSGVARADFIVDADDRAWFLEVNTLPGMTATSLSPMAAGAVGLSFEDLVEGLLRSATLHIPRAAPPA